MIRNVVGALVGAELERSRGGGGLKGAAVGTVAAFALRRMGLPGLVLGGAWAAKRACDRRKGTRNGLTA